MRDTVLITLGRLPKGLEIASAIARAGRRVVIAEPWGWHLARMSRAVAACHRVTAPNEDVDRYRRDMLEVIERERVGLVIPVSEEVLHAASLAPMLPAGTRWFGAPRDDLLGLHDKLAFIRTAGDLVGLPVPETFELGDETARRFASTRDTIVKPRFGSAGQDLAICRAGEGLPKRAGASVVQAYLPGEELSSFSIAHAGRVVGTVVYRGHVFSGTVAVVFEALPQPDPELLAWVRRFVAGTGHEGFISFDWRRDGDGRALPIECNPRTTSGIHFVDPGDLAAAILEPERENAFRLRTETTLQQFYPALTETQGAFFRGRAWRGNLKYLFGCRDVSWNRRDPWPFALMPVNSWEILRRTIFRRMSFGEATTEDIGWYS